MPACITFSPRAGLGLHCGDGNYSLGLLVGSTTKKRNGWTESEAGFHDSVQDVDSIWEPADMLLFPEGLT